jgi:hypothetical protein
MLNEKVCNIDKDKVYCCQSRKDQYEIYCFHNDWDKNLYVSVRQKFSSGQFFGVDFEPNFCPFCGFTYQPERLNPETPKGDAIV